MRENKELKQKSGFWRFFLCRDGLIISDSDMVAGLLSVIGICMATLQSFLQPMLWVGIGVCGGGFLLGFLGLYIKECRGGEDD